MLDLLLGRLSFDALPFYSAIAATAAGIVVFGALGVLALITAMGKWRYLWNEWLTTLDHKRIGILYILLGFVMLARGFIEAMMMRTQQAIAMNAEGYLPPEHFNQLFSTHGTIMIFFVLMPFLTGLINYVLPLQLGARDMAFPWMNAISLWTTYAGAGLMMASLVLGRFSTGGWSGYPPYTGVETSPGVGVDYWIWAINVAGVGTTLSGVNFIVTIWKKRCPEMNRLMNMPLFCWTTLCASLLIIFAFPSLTVGTLMLSLDRTFGFNFFTYFRGGDPMQYINLFWIWGHPEVYILILPAFGVFSEVISTFSSKRLFGYSSLVYATMAIAVLSFVVWVHHFFTMGADADVNAFFGIMTMVIAVPTGVKVYDWLFTMYRGRLRFTTPMLYSLGFIVTFVIGGVTGVLLAIPPFDFTVNNSTFLVAHFHNMLIPGSLFGFFAGYTYWFPKALGFRLHEGWGKAGFWFWITGFYAAFMPLYVLGLMGMSRRMQQYDQPEWQPLLILASLGAGLVAIGIFCQIMQLVVSIRRRVELRDRTGDPWDGRALEWSTSSPPPEWNFATAPKVPGRDPFMQAKLDGTAYRRPEPGDYAPLELPRNTGTALFIGMLSFALGFGVVWYMWWLAAAALLGIVAVMIARSMQRNVERVVPVSEQMAHDNAHHTRLVAQAGGLDISHGVPRTIELRHDPETGRAPA